MDEGTKAVVEASTSTAFALIARPHGVDEKTMCAVFGAEAAPGTRLRTPSTSAQFAPVCWAGDIAADAAPKHSKHLRQGAKPREAGLAQEVGHN